MATKSKKNNVRESGDLIQIFYEGVRVIEFEREQLLVNPANEIEGYYYSILDIDSEKLIQMKASNVHMLRWLVGASEKEIKVFWISQLTSLHREFDEFKKGKS